MNDGEWEEKKLGAIGEPLMCKRILKEQTTSNPKNGIPFYKIGTFGKEADSFIPIELYEEFKNKYSFPNVGDILISASGTIGRLVVYDGSPAFFQDSNIVWLGNNEELVLNTFLFHYYSKIKWQTSDGGIISRLYNSDLKNMKILFPKEKREQQKTAACLSSLDELITAHSQKLAALKEHKKGLMQNLFPQEGETVPKQRFPEFAKDGEWEEKKLEEIAEIGRGKSKHRPRDAEFLYGGKYPFVQTGDIKKAGLYLTEFSQTYSEEGLKQSKLWQENTLCITIAANIAETSILKIKACFPDSIIGLNTNENTTNVLFIKYSFDVFKESIQSLSQGVAQDNLNQEKLSKIEFVFPSLKEQQKIASCLSALDESITAQSDKIAQLKLHKKGLMQGLFPKIND